MHVLFVNWVLMEDTSPRFIFWGVINLIKSHFSLIYLLGGYKSDLVIYTTIILPEFITEKRYSKVLFGQHACMALFRHLMASVEGSSWRELSS